MLHPSPAPGKKEITNVSVNTAPTTTVYHEGEVFNAEGLTLTVEYNDGTSEVKAPDGYDLMLFNAGGEYGEGEYPVHAYVMDEDDNTFSTTVYITVYAMTQLVVTTSPDKTTYNANETLDLAGLSVTATYTDSNDVVFDYSQGQMVEGWIFSPDTTTALTTDITEVSILYGIDSETYSGSATFSITVSE